MIWMRSSRVVSLMSTLRFMGTPLCRDWKVTVRMSCGMVNNLHSHVEVLIVPLNDAFARRLSFITLGLYRPFRRGAQPNPVGTDRYLPKQVTNRPNGRGMEKTPLSRTVTDGIRPPTVRANGVFHQTPSERTVPSQTHPHLGKYTQPTPLLR